MSRGSAFYENERRRHDAVTRRIDELLARRAQTWDTLTDAGRAHAERAVNRVAAALEAERGLTRTILHCDMDMFYAAVELQARPELRGTCFAVGHGVLLTASYEARQLGVRSGMAEFVARALCPELVVLPSRFSAYKACSRAIMAVMARYDAQLYPRSLDEAYLDITDYAARHGQTPRDVALQLKADVHAATGLTVSVGIAPNMLLAKVASDRDKPDGCCEVPPTRDAILAFMAPLRVRQVPGIGRVAERVLGALGVQTCADVWARRVELSVCLDGFRPLLAAALGLGATAIAPPQRAARRSVGRESTFAPTADVATLHARLREACEQLAHDLDRLEYTARTVSLVGKHDTFERFTRARSCPGGVASFDDLYTITHALLAQERHTFPGPLRLRLIGVRASALVDQRAARRGPLAQWLRQPAPGKQGVQCPVCGADLGVGATQLAQINAHIDACLRPPAPPAPPAPPKHEPPPREPRHAPQRPPKRQRGQATMDSFLRRGTQDKGRGGVG